VDASRNGRGDTVIAFLRRLRRGPLRTAWLTRRPGPTVSRLAIAAAMLAAAGGCYLLVLLHADLAERPRERDFGTSARDAVLRIYVEPISLDAVNQSMQLRISVAAGGVGGEIATAPDRDLMLLIGHDQVVDSIAISANRPVPAATLAVDLNDGSVNDYPLDAYHSAIRLQCVGGPQAQPGRAPLLPVQVTAWEGLLGFHLSVRATPDSRPGAVTLAYSIRRAGAFTFFALAGYGAMIVLALGALAVGTLVFAGLRRVEVTLMGALGAAVFALPALRNALPGGPPLGVRADLFVFLWTELAAVIAFGLLVTAWVLRGPRP